MEQTVGEMRALIQHTATNQQQREDQLQNTLAQLTGQVQRQDAVSEMLPVLQEICGEYAQQQNVKVQQ